MGVMLMVWLKCLKKVECDSVVFWVSEVMVYVWLGCVCMLCSVVVRWVLVRLCMRLGEVVLFWVECSVLMSSIFSSCVSILLCVGCLVWVLLMSSCIRVVSCGLVCICMS